MFGSIFGLGKFTGIVGKILEFSPVAIDIVERLFGSGDGPLKKLKAGKEVFEFVRELIENRDEFDSFEDLDIDVGAVLRALEDEEVFVNKIEAVNDAIVDLANYVNSFAQEDEG